MSDRFPLRQIEQHFKDVMVYAPHLMGNDAVNFFTDRFNAQNWMDDQPEPWTPRKTVNKWGNKTPRNLGRKILIDKGHLRRSIRITSVGIGTATVGTDVPYAKMHNEGFNGVITQQVRSYTRKITKAGIVKRTQLKTRTKVEFGRVETGVAVVKAHQRKIHMIMPRRQFMGRSNALSKILYNRLLGELNKAQRFLQ